MRKEADSEATLPINPEAEEALVGSMLLDPTIIAKVNHLVQPKDFFNPVCGLIYKAMGELFEQRTPADLVLLRGILHRNNILGDGEGQVSGKYLLQLLMTTDTPIYAEHYAKVVLQYAARRRLIEAGGKIASLGMRDTMTLASMVREAAGLVAGVSIDMASLADDHNFTTHEDMMNPDDLIESNNRRLVLEQRKQGNQDYCHYLVTGLPTFDGVGDPSSGQYRETLVRLRRKRVMLFVAPSGGGKTSYLVQLAQINALRGAKLLFLYNELDVAEFKKRIFMQLSKPTLDYTRLEDHDNYDTTLTDDEITRITQVSDKLLHYKGRIDYYRVTGMDDLEISNLVGRLNSDELARTNIGYTGVILDYAKRVALPKGNRGNGMSVADQRSLQCNTFSDMANTLDLSFIWAQQLKRGEGALRGDKVFQEPREDSVFDSKTYFDQAQVVIFAWREGSQDANDPGYFTLAKNTSGKTFNQLPVVYSGGTFEWSEYMGGPRPPKPDKNKTKTGGESW